MALTYHKGQRELQSEANTIDVADMLADWVGPVSEFCRSADLIVLATLDGQSRLKFMAISGPPPLVEVSGPSTVNIEIADQLSMSPLAAGTEFGGIAIGLSVARRARLNGTLFRTARGLRLEANEAFTNCRKYIAPSASLAEDRVSGPMAREPIQLKDPWLLEVVRSAETSFLATVSPDGGIDVSHRGGPAGFLRLYPEGEGLEWDEFVGDGMFKSAGNVRATGRFALLVPDLSTGDAVELAGTARIEVFRRDKRPRVDALLQQKESHPVQGRMACSIDEAYSLRGFMPARKRLAKRLPVTSVSIIEEQYPQ
jgi:hypothetical protein